MRRLVARLLAGYSGGGALEGRGSSDATASSACGAPHIAHTQSQEGAFTQHAGAGRELGEEGRGGGSSATCACLLAAARLLPCETAAVLLNLARAVMMAMTVGGVWGVEGEGGGEGEGEEGEVGHEIRSHFVMLSRGEKAEGEAHWEAGRGRNAEGPANKMRGRGRQPTLKAVAASEAGGQGGTAASQGVGPQQGGSAAGVAVTVLSAVAQWLRIAAVASRHAPLLWRKVREGRGGWEERTGACCTCGDCAVRDVSVLKETTAQ